MIIGFSRKCPKCGKGRIDKTRKGAYNCRDCDREFSGVRLFGLIRISW